MEGKSCPNCSVYFEGSFCPNCGQKRFIIPFTFKFIAHSAFELLDFNRGFFFTLFCTIIKPGELIHGYLKGRTRNFNNPVRFLLTLITLLAILDFVRSGNEEIKALYLMPSVLVLSILTAIFNYVVFRNDRGLVEHIIISIYFTSAVFIILTLITLLFLALESYDILPYSDKLAASIYVPAALIFMVRFNLQVFSGRNLNIILKSLLYLVTLPSILFLFGYLLKLLKSL